MKYLRFSILAVLAALAPLAPGARAQTTFWTGAGGDLVWSDPANWASVVPGITTTVCFTNANTVAGVGAASSNNIVSANIQIASLQYTNTAGSHNTLIDPGVTLTISNTAAVNALFYGGFENIAVTNTISGANGTLFVTNSAGVINGYMGGGANGVQTQNARMDMSGLGTLVAYIGNFWVAGNNASGSGTQIRELATMLLAATNTIRTYGAAPQFCVNNNSDDGSGGGNPATDCQSTLELGLTNAIYSDSIEIGDEKGAGQMFFNPAFVGGVNAPVVFINGRSAARVATFNIGDDALQGSSNQQSLGLVDFTGGTVNALVASCIVGNGQNGGGSSSGLVTGTLNIGAGNFNVNTLGIGDQTATNCSTPLSGTVNLENRGTLTVNTLMEIAGVSFKAATTGTLNATNSTLTINGTVLAGGGTSTINVVGGTLNLNFAASTVGTRAAPISYLSLSNTTVNLGILSGQHKVVASTLTANGTITLNFSAVLGFAAYPTNIQVFLSTNGPIQGAGGAAFTLGTLPAGVSATLVNDTASNSIDLDIASGPTPLGPLTWNGQTNSVNVGVWDINVTPDWLLVNGSPSVYQDINPVTFNDSASGATNIILTTNVLPTSVTVSNTVLAYTFTGPNAISGAGGLYKDGTNILTLLESGGDSFGGGIIVTNGTLILDDTNCAIAGGVTVFGGATLQVGNNDGGGALPTPVIDNGAIVLDRSDAGLMAGVISGTGMVAVVGSGTVTLSGVQAYKGPTFVTGGTLLVSSPNTSPGGLASSTNLTITEGSVVLNSDNALSGSGANPLPVTLNQGGVLTGSSAADSGAGTSAHLTGVLTFNGGTLAMGGTSINTANGTWDLQGIPAVVVPGTNPVTSTLSALDMIPTATGGTIFDITNASTPSGIDLNITGSLINGTGINDSGITLNGNGTMALDNNNTYAMGTTVNGGTLQIGEPGDVAPLSTPLGTGIGFVMLNNNAVLEFNSGKGVTVTNSIAGGSTCTVLSNRGTNIFVGQNTYGGATIVSGGGLLLQGSASINGSASITVSNATLDVSASSTAINNGNAALSLDNSVFNMGANLVDSLGSFASSNSSASFYINPRGAANITASTVTLGGSANLINLLAVPGYPVYPTNVALIQYSGGGFQNVNANNALTNLSVALPTLGSPVGYLTNNTSDNQIQLVLLSDTLSPIFPVIWNGQTNGINVAVWDLTTPDWVLTSDDATPAKFANATPSGSAVTFDDTARGPTNVNLVISALPSSVTFSNINKTFTISGAGSINSGSVVMDNSGKAILAETGSDTFGGGVFVNAGTLVLSNANASFSGGLTVNGGLLVDQHKGSIYGGVTANGGTALLDQVGAINGNVTISSGGVVQIGNNDTNGVPPTGTIADGGGLVFDRSDSNLVVKSVISGSGGVTNNGTGAVTLGVTETLAGPVVVNAGMLILDAGNNVAPNGISAASALVINTNASVGVLVDNSLDGHGANGLPATGGVPIYINAGGALTSAPGSDAGAGISCHLSALLTLNGGTLAMGGTPAANTFANGSWDLDGGLSTEGGSIMSVISAPCVIPSESGGTIFTVLPGTTPGGIDLDVTGTLISGNGGTNDTGVVFTGGGTMRMSNTNTYAGGTVLEAGVLIVNAPEHPGFSGPLGTNLILFAGGTLEFSANNTYDYSSRISGSPYNIDTAGQLVTFASDLSPSALTKFDSGTLILSGTNNYGGNTAVAGGNLILTTASSGSGSSFIVTNASTLDVQVAVAGATFNMSSLTLGASGADASTLQIDTLATGNPATAPVNAGAITTNGTVNIQLSGTALTPGSFPLLAYSGASPSGALHFVPPFGFKGTLSDNNAGLISVTLVSAPVHPAHITGFAVNGRALTITASNGADSGQFTLFESTNLLMPLSQWTPIWTNNFNASGNLNQTTNIIIPGKTDMFYDLVQP